MVKNIALGLLVQLSYVQYLHTVELFRNKYQHSHHIYISGRSGNVRYSDADVVHIGASVSISQRQ